MVQSSPAPFVDMDKKRLLSGREKESTALKKPKVVDGEDPDTSFETVDEEIIIVGSNNEFMEELQERFGSIFDSETDPTVILSYHIFMFINYHFSWKFSGQTQQLLHSATE